ncbi:hypothetical protein BDD12DRAFT_758415 [Trichophaea hybrida]|nr:hypothetical protein BDD12DRAFT_758415 [Trichophaea hybrida]
MAADETVAVNRPKRVRTGCLTCRERHLKCDEGTPDCQNCRKSSRICKRGIRLNFIDIQTEQPPVMPISHKWRVHFQDESRDIASEYAGGVKRYAPFINTGTPIRTTISPHTPWSNPSPSGLRTPSSATPTLPSILPLLPDRLHSRERMSSHKDTRPRHHHLQTSVCPTYTAAQQHPPPPPPSECYLENSEETLFMQVFVEEVGIWMDSLDPLKHFSRLLPFSSLCEPMLLNAFLACGARHLTLVNPAYHEDKALNYYDTATRLILASLQNQNRDTEICATTAIILNVYEIMSERPLQRMNHIAGARALLKECGWSARTSGVGGACFWLNVTMELLSCLRFNWAVAWDPDEWGVDVDFNRSCEPGGEELWAHRIIYILAKIANFKAAVKREDNSDQIYMSAETIQNRYSEWSRLRDMCVSWNEHIPRNMHPMAYLHPYQTTTKSSFPEVWLIKRCAVVARLFYHTAMVIVAQINPYPNSDMQEMALNHAHQICGIAAHVKDRGVASVALRSLATAAECLTDRREQEEVLDIFTKIKKATGWRVNFVLKELRESWGWEVVEPTSKQQSLPAVLNQHRNQPQYSQFQPQQQQAEVWQQQYQEREQHQHQQHRRLVNPLELNSHTHPYHPHYVSAPQQEHHQYHVQRLHYMH